MRVRGRIWIEVLWLQISCLSPVRLSSMKWCYESSTLVTGCKERKSVILFPGSSSHQVKMRLERVFPEASELTCVISSCDQKLKWGPERKEPWDRCEWLDVRWLTVSYSWHNWWVMMYPVEAGLTGGRRGSLSSRNTPQLLSFYYSWPVNISGNG